MKLYDFPFSPNSRKVRAVAYERAFHRDGVMRAIEGVEIRTARSCACTTSCSRR